VRPRTAFTGQPLSSGTRRPPPGSGNRGWTPSDQDFRDAVWIVDRSGVVPIIEAAVDSPTGRPRALSVKALYVAAQLNALRRPRWARVSDIADVIASLTEDQRRALGIRSWPRDGAYKRVYYVFNKIAQASLEEQ
jgi:hypothetical protein